MMDENTALDTTTETGISKVETWAKVLVIATPEQHTSAMTTLKEIKALRTRIVDFFKESKEAAHKAWKAIVANEKTFTDRLDNAEVDAKRTILKYQQAEEQKRIAEQQKLQAMADEKARKEREKLAEQARKAEAAGKAEKAEALRAQAEVVAAPVVRVESKVEANGSSIRKTWKCRVVDAAKVPREYMLINQQALDAIARATKGAVVVPGCEMYEDSGLSVRMK